MPEPLFSRFVYIIVNKVTLQSLSLICNTCIIKQGTKFKFISISHTVIESYKGLDVYLTSLSQFIVPTILTIVRFEHR